MKRACPYDANLLRMSKVHLMDHDIDLSVLSKIQEETLQKLWNGARNPPKPDEMLPVKPLPAYFSKPSKQTLLSTFLSGAPAVGQTFIKLSVPDSKTDLGRCCYCEKESTTSTCRVCKDAFCVSCSISDYSSNSELIVCLSCS